MQHRIGHIVGHAHQQGVAGIAIQPPVTQTLVKRNLDIHFPVRAVHTAGVINGVGIDAPAIERKFNAPQLREPQVAALTHYLAAQFLAVHTNGIVGPVSHLAMTLVTAFHIGADTAVPEQLHRRLENRHDQFCRGQRPFTDAQRLAGRFTEFDALGAARPDTAALGHGLAVEIIPGGAPGRKQALALGKGGRRIRVWVDKDVQVIEGRD